APCFAGCGSVIRCGSLSRGRRAAATSRSSWRATTGRRSALRIYRAPAIGSGRCGNAGWQASREVLRRGGSSAAKPLALLRFFLAALIVLPLAILLELARRDDSLEPVIEALVFLRK